jgi:predicted ATPase/DNA-binding CsgD family transcriptional regulator
MTAKVVGRMTTTKPVATGLGKLPAELTSFVGRRREMAEARRKLSSSRLLTLTGVGGVGKTRLAMRMAADVRRSFADGVWFAKLAALHDPSLLPHTVANALELRQVSADPTADLVEYLEDKQLLLILDNCEHLTQPCAVLGGKLLAAAPGVRLMATSRHVLGVEGERILPVPPLSVPEADVPRGDATHNESVALFFDRATAVAPDFQIVDANRHAVIELCRRLEGIPLAIELAAVWLRTLTPAQILDRLEDRFSLLASGRLDSPPRQQALEATIDWSFDLCSPTEQELWTRLTVFSGGFDLEAAEQVCSIDGIERDSVLGLVAGLMDKSIITRERATEHTTAWYTMLETIRQYGAVRLTPEATHMLRVRHRDYYRTLASQYAAECFSPRQADWFIRLRREHGNLRTALDFCLTEPGEAAAALEIAAPIWNFWFAGLLREGHRYLERALDLATDQTPARATALWAASYLAMFARETEQTRTMLAECSELAERFDDDLLRARIKECRGHAALYEGDLRGAIPLLDDARRCFHAVGDQLGEFDSLILLAAGSFFLGDPRVREYSEEALALAESQHAESSMAYALWGVGITYWRDGRVVEATHALREAVRLWQPLHDLTGIGFAVQALSWCGASTRPDERAARLLGASQAVWRVSGAKVDETMLYSQFDQQSRDLVRGALGDARFDQAFADGSSYSFEQAVALALGKDTARDATGQPSTSRGKPGTASGLTRRELEIAELLGEGLNNKEIAARLVISQRTAETHVENILNKLGFTSRAQVASWVTERRAP